MSKEEVIELLESLKGDTSGIMQSNRISQSELYSSLGETIHEGRFNARIDEAIKELNQNKEDE